MWQKTAVLSCAANIENFTRQKKKGVEKPQAVECYAAIKERRKSFGDTKQAHGNKSSRADHAHMKKINFTRQKWKFYAAKRTRGNNQTTGKNLVRHMNSRKGEKYYAATIIFPRIKFGKLKWGIESSRNNEKWIPQQIK